MSNAILDANGGIDSARALSTAHHILSSHDLCQPVLYHIVLTGSQDIATYQAVIKSLIRRLRSKCRTEYFGAYEMADNKGLHAHCFILIETSKKTPYKILDVNDGEYLHKLALRHKLEDKDGTKKRIHVSKPKNRMHQGQFFARPVGEELLADCMKWCSYEYKKRSKEGVQSRETYFNSEFKSNTTKRKAEKIAKGYVASTPPLDAPAANQEADVFIETPVFAAPDHLKGILTMSSVEIVEVINAMRGPGKAELAHRTFMEKLRNHPGINGQNFLHVYLGGNGEQRPCYYLPKREAELMVMSEIFPKSGESLEVQQPSNSTTSNTNNPFPQVGSRLEGQSLLTAKELQHERSNRESACQASRSTGEAGNISQDHASQDNGTSTTESRYSDTSSSALGFTGPRPRVPLASASGPTNQAIRAGQEHGGATGEKHDTRSPVTTGVDERFLDTGESNSPICLIGQLAQETGMTPAQKYIGSLYEAGVDAQLDVDALRSFLLTQGIKRTPAQVVYELESVYSFHDYASRHPAPAPVDVAVMDRMIELMNDRDVKRLPIPAL